LTVEHSLKTPAHTFHKAEILIHLGNKEETI